MRGLWHPALAPAESAQLSRVPAPVTFQRPPHPHHRSQRKNICRDARSSPAEPRRSSLVLALLCNPPSACSFICLPSPSLPLLQPPEQATAKPASSHRASSAGIRTQHGSTKVDKRRASTRNPLSTARQPASGSASQVARCFSGILSRSYAATALC